MQGKRTMIPWKILEGDFSYYTVCRDSYKLLESMKKKNGLLEIA